MKVAIVGDVFVPYGASNVPDTSGIRHLLSDADYIVANIEGVLTQSVRGKHGTRRALRQDPKMLTLLKDLNIHYGHIANNHVLDYGEAGLVETVDQLAASGVTPLGAGVRLCEAHRGAVIGSKCNRVGLICAAETLSLHQGHGTAGSARILSPEFEETLKTLQTSCSSVIVSVHAGAEHIETPLPQWRATFKKLIERGVSAVVGHHPHVPQGVEEHNGSPIFYSVGDFYFYKKRSQPERYWSQIPVFRFSGGELADWHVRHTRFSVEGGGQIVDNDLAGRLRMNTLSSTLQDFEAYQRALDHDLNWLWRARYGPGLEASLPFALAGKMSLTSFPRRIARYVTSGGPWHDPSVLHDFMNIESHRWALSEILSRRARR